MKIVHIVPGTGGQFYCQNCMRDAGLVKALRLRGHDIIMTPMYLPLGVDDPKPTGDVPVFYGAVTCYLKEKAPFLRKMPRWLERAIDAPPVLRWAARRSGATKATGLEEMTLSVLRGEEGNQADALERLLGWIRTEAPPDVVHISNALLLGLAPRLRTELRCALVCSLQDELPWIETMNPAAVKAVRALLSEKARWVDAFIPVSATYAARMQAWLGCPPEKMHVAPVGIDPAGYRTARHTAGNPRIGFLSRTGPEQGLDVLVEAFLELRRRPGLEGVRLAVTGGTPPQDRRFVRGLKRKLKQADAHRAVEFIEDFGRDRRQAFLGDLAVLSVPVRGGDAFGLYLAEAMASGVPVVQPRQGSAVELIEASGGGVLCEPGSATALANALDGLLRDAPKRAALGRSGREYVLRNLTHASVADRVASIYAQAVTDRNRCAGLSGG